MTLVISRIVCWTLTFKYIAEESDGETGSTDPHECFTFPISNTEALFPDAVENERAFLGGRSIACLLLLPLFVDAFPAFIFKPKRVRTRLCYWLKITLKLQPLNPSQQWTDKKVCLFLLASVQTSHGTFPQKSFPLDGGIDLTVVRL